MPSRLASDRPIKNVIGSVNQTLLQRGGWAGRWAGGGGCRGIEGNRTTRGSAGKERWEERGGSGGVVRDYTTHCSPPLSAHCPEALSNGYRGVQLLCFVVCLYPGQGG